MSEFRFCPMCASALGAAQCGGVVRRTCTRPGCGWVHWDNPVPVVAAILQCVDRDGTMLIARNSAWPQKKFGLVTGFLERDEAPHDAVAREVVEETALEVMSASLFGVYPFARMNQVLLAYHVRARGEIRLNEELAEYRLIAPERLVPWPEGTGPAVRDWLSNQGIMPAARSVR